MPALFLSSRKRTPEMMKTHWPLNLVFFFIIFIILLFVTMAEFLLVSVSVFFLYFFQRHVRLHLKTLFEFYACA